jgi:hypothetical protein
MKSSQHLIYSGIAFTLILTLWPLLMAISQPEGSLEDELHWITQNLTQHKIKFFFALLISPALVYMMLSQVLHVPKVDKISMRSAMIFLAVYATLVTISYSSQLILLPALIEAELINEAKIWYFETPYSVPYFINQSGYFFWAIAASVLFFRFRMHHGMIRYFSLLYTVSAVLSIIAFLGLVMDIGWMKLMTFPSGLLLLPVGIMSVIWGIRENRSR